MSGARHTMSDDSWRTPPALVELARTALEHIDLDPASSAQANAVVRADVYHTAADDGLSRDWRGRVFLNPPGGLVLAFWEKLICSYQQGTVTQAIWVGYSLEQLQTLQHGPAHPLEFPICIPRKRLAFVETPERRAARFEKIARNNAEREALGLRPLPMKDAVSPSHGNYIAYLGPEILRFQMTFTPLGIVSIPE